MRIYLRHRFVNLFSLCTLLRNSIGGVVRDVWHCSGMGRQHVLATGSLAPSCGCAAQRLALRETLLPRPPDDARSALPILALACVLHGKRRARTPYPPQDAALPCGGGHRSMARSSGGQGYVQHYSITKRPGEVVLPGTSFPACSQAEEFFPETQAPAACAAARSVAFLRHENRRCRERRHGQPLRHACPA